MKRLCLLVAICLAGTARADKPTGNSFDVALDAGKVHEECVRLEAGQKRRYYWKSTAPVDFNIHFHKGDEVVYPLKREGMRGDGGTFTAKSGEEHCWMWTARNAGTKVQGMID